MIVLFKERLEEIKYGKFFFNGTNHPLNLFSWSLKHHWSSYKKLKFWISHAVILNKKVKLKNRVYGNFSLYSMTKKNWTSTSFLSVGKRNYFLYTSDKKVTCKILIHCFHGLQKCEGQMIVKNSLFDKNWSWKLLI